MSVVLDASLLVAVLVHDEDQEVARGRIERWLDDGEGLHAPGVLPYEIANVLSRRVFDRLLELEDVNEIWSDLGALGLVLHPFEPVRDGPEVAALTARLDRRHATDSAYVCLALRLGTAVWTLDAALARNAAGAGLPVTLLT